MQHHDQSRFPDLRPYTLGMGRKLTKTRPPQAARLVALRKAAGLSQAELARLIGEPQANIAFCFSGALFVIQSWALTRPRASAFSAMVAAGS